MNLARACALALVAATSGGLAAAQPADADRESEIVRLRRDNRVAEVELARLRQVIARLESELAAAREELEGLRTAPEPEDDSPTGRESVLVDPLSGVEEEELTDEELFEPTPEEDPTDPGPADEDMDEEPADEEPADEEPPPVVTAEARALYDESYTRFHEKRYRESESGFRRFLDLYPRVELADNAQFWIGECRFALGEYDDALEAFMATVERYPDGNKVPDALYKAGRCLESLGDRAKARATYEEVGRLFPSSAAALAARERLADLR